MIHIKKFNESLDLSLKYSDKEITEFIDWVAKYCTERLRFNYQYIDGEEGLIPGYCIWVFNKKYYSSTDEYIKNWRSRRTTFDLYKIWSDEQIGDIIKPTIKQELDNKFIPVNFLEYIAKSGYWLYKSSFNGVPQPSYWTKGDNANGKFTLKDLFDKFKSKL